MIPTISFRLSRGWEYPVGRGPKRHNVRHEEVWVAHWEIVGTGRRGDLPVTDAAGTFMKGFTEEEALREAEANLARMVGSAVIQWVP